MGTSQQIAAIYIHGSLDPASQERSRAPRHLIDWLIGMVTPIPSIAHDAAFEDGW